MASVNKVILLGNLGADPETKYLPSGDAVSNFRIATTEAWTDKASGQKKEQTEWHRCSAFGRTAEVAGEYLKKGSAVYVEGRIQTRKWQDKDGKDQYTTEVRVDRLQLLGGKPQQDRQEPAKTARAPAGDTFDDDIPFAPLGHRQAWRVM